VARTCTPVPLRSWEYWCGETMGLGRLLPGDTVAILKQLGYDDANTLCVLCGQEPDGLDWYCLNGLVGPCCAMQKCQNDAKESVNGTS
jgi:hypothetical protein